MGFETVVRPVVFPNIRPAPARTLPPVSNSEQGFCVINGASGKAVSLTYSWNANHSKSRAVETERRVDVMRVYQKEDDGTINKKNFLDVEVANRLKTKGGKLPSSRSIPAPSPGGGAPEPDTYPDSLAEDLMYFYAAPEPVDNMEFIARNVIKKNPQAPSE